MSIWIPRVFFKKLNFEGGEISRAHVGQRQGRGRIAEPQRKMGLRHQIFVQRNHQMPYLRHRIQR